VIATGYYGIPGRYGGQVHVVRDGKPLCGLRPHPKAEFQWCCHGFNLSYVELECRRCHDRATRLLARARLGAQRGR
jgi:hypothetical protein